MLGFFPVLLLIFFGLAITKLVVHFCCCYTFAFCIHFWYVLCIIVCYSFVCFSAFWYCLPYFLACLIFYSGFVHCLLVFLLTNYSCLTLFDFCRFLSVTPGKRTRAENLGQPVGHDKKQTWCLRRLLYQCPCQDRVHASSAWALSASRNLVFC